MKKIGLVLGFILFFSTASQLNAQWFWQNPLPFGPFFLQDVHIFDENNFIATSWEGYLLKSTDGGETWLTIDIQNTKRLYAIFFINDQIGWISGEDGILLKTTDGGNNWDLSNIGYSNILYDIYFVDENVGFITSNYSSIFKTTDGGITWDSRQVGSGWNNLYRLCFIDSSHGFIVGREIFKTVNAGQTWEIINAPEPYSNSIYFIDENNGYVGTYQGKILKTTDGGVTWSTIALGFEFVLNDITFINPTKGFAVGRNGIFLTTNAGTTWDTISVSQSYFNSVKIKNNTVVCVGNTSLAVSQDGGNLWELKSKSSINSYLYSVKFLDNNYGWVCGTGFLPVAANTTDGGANWNSVNVPTNHLLDIYFINKNVGFAVGEASFVGRTTDSGNNWEDLSLGSVNRSISFSDSLNGWIVGDRYILKTTDGGFNWASQEFIGKELNACFFINSNLGWVIGNNIIKKTTDGGLNWIDNIISGNYYNIFFANEVDGWIAGWPGKILKSSDGGINWFEQNSGTNLGIFSVFGLDAENVWAVGDSGLILKSTNGGDNWIKQKINTNTFFLDVFFTDYNNGWVVGTSGAILHTTNGGVTFIEEENTSIQPKEYLLHQNYPNPFNPSTKISWQSSIGSWQTLKVYDILGNEVATLVNEYRNAGSYEVDFPSVETGRAPSLPSGVYFYQLRTGDYVETKKMILLK
jgi:photosystem II stability/assembly factor-like uncharacterized protein